MHAAEIVIMETAYGEDAVWHPDLNLVVLHPRLDEAGREQALDELQARWRRSLRFHGSADPLSAC